MPNAARIRKRINSDLDSINNPSVLSQVLDFLQLVKGKNVPLSSNKKEVLSFAGSISSEEAREVLKIISQEFNQIEGEW